MSKRIINKSYHGISSKAIFAFVFIFCFLTVLGVSCVFILKQETPEYATWTGIRPLETKLELLKNFSAKGEVDTLLLGSSIVDFGFSAELFSELMSNHLGHEYRAFNFATGGAEPRTLPILYRLARLVSKPKSVFVIMPAEFKLPEYNDPGSPDYTLYKSPIGDSLSSQELLTVSWYKWKSPIMQTMPGVRDLILYGEFYNLQKNLGMELYEVNENGDRLNFAFMQDKRKLSYLKQLMEAHIQPFERNTNEKLHKMTKFYFSDKDIKGMLELNEMIKDDGAKLYIIPHAGAATIWNGTTSKTYIQARHDFFQAYPAAQQAILCDDITNDLDIPEYAIADTTHLNTHGARIFTRAAFKAMMKNSEVYEESDVLGPPSDLFSSVSKTFNTFSALVKRPKNMLNSVLHFRIVSSSSVPTLPNSKLLVALRTPQNTDIIVEAIRLGPNEFIAKTDLPMSMNSEMFVFRLLVESNSQNIALNSPLADYEWIASDPRKSHQPSNFESKE